MQKRKASTTRRAASPAAASALDALGAPVGVHPDVPAGEEDAQPAAVGAPVSEQYGNPSVARVGFAPIVRVDAVRREIELCATSEALDSYGTVFDYAASKDAFTRWIGNVREMHERRAVGSRVGVRCDDDQRKVFVRVRISQGAEDTWEKVRDGTLRGASIGASNVVWERQARRVAGRERVLNVATRYDLVELSLVDSPSNPDALGITIVRDAVPDAAMLDDLTAGAAGAAGSAPTASPENGRAPENGRPADAPTTVDADGATSRRDASATFPAAFAAADAAGGAITTPSNEAGAPPEVRIARQVAAHGWATIQAAHGGKSLPEEGGRGGESLVAENGTRGRKLPAHETGGLKPGLVEAAFYQPPLPGLGDLEPTALFGGTDTRAPGPFSANAEGYPDVGVPARAEARPTSALGQREEGNARARFHAAARGILLGCGCPLCEGALAALGETGAGMGAAHESEIGAMRDGGVGASGGRPDSMVRESALARALSFGLSASVTRMERVDESVRGLGDLLQTAVSQIEGTASDLRRRIETMEAQPLPGGPTAFAFDKSLALAPGGSGGGVIRSQPGAAEQRRALESLAGKLTDPQAQIAVAAELIRLQRGE